ncbi:hypothetical protein GEPA3_0534 [Geobacillus sp. PA-3]|jgi:hypothetical protein|uniref:glycosyl hydrolase 115 family protein n=1 Tax=Geobacillus sp. PA-3 TaxID=1699078 RepID=UPI0006E65445|nr:glycosyl hydrolase 115 family protein [Geobacillus sp. PA-3]KQB94466.1 hypothetical protein GEPA3_0534 [Geobacillus sp. PA-3]
MNHVVIHRDSAIFLSENMPTAVKHAFDMIVRDHQKVFGVLPKFASSPTDADLVIRYATEEDMCPKRVEAFSFRFKQHNGSWSLHIVGNDDLGLVYGLLHYSQTYLGVDPFWFWADIPVSRKSKIEIPVKNFDSPERKVKYRGWFINDEDCLIGWKKGYPPTKEVWYPVFEALLRCGGNMVIPGTDLPRHGIHTDLASEMGLWVTHHHAEPLGAEMFLRAYPGKKPSYKEHPELFEALWAEAIEKQKNRKTIWVLSFRGQGDAPFWHDDQEFDTPEKRGEMISQVVRRQYEMVCQSVDNPVCCIALYGEIAELYKDGHITVPEGVIKIWADNGYGKMVSRRQGNENLRIPSLPAPNDDGEHGVYYHITFHDLQASNHLTMFPSPPELIVKELRKAFDAGATAYLLVNSGNIRPHLYTIDLVSRLWNEGSIDIDRHLQEFVSRLYTAKHQEIADLYRCYFEKSIIYGPNEDDRAGEEFYHHNARRIVAHWMKGNRNAPEPKLFWATGERPFPEQVRWFEEKCKEGLEGWEELYRSCNRLSEQLPEEDRQRFYDQFVLSVKLHVSGCKGFLALCNAFFTFMKHDYPLAFVQVSQSIDYYKEGLFALKCSEHGKWEHFYRADWLTNIKSTLYSLDSLRKFIRMQGDSPHFFLWYREYLMSEIEKHIYLENTHRNPLSDDELAAKLKEKFNIQ